MTGPARPRLGFLGTGWIGRNRMDAIASSGVCEVAAIADADTSLARTAAEAVGCKTVVETLDQLLETGVDGVVIATPSALHAEQALRALEAEVAVFCQKPLGRTAEETRAVVDAAHRNDQLLGVDFSYRHASAFRAVHDLVGSGEIGQVFAVDLVFHNAYGPDKAWFYERERSGGGCLIDLGIHLLDLLAWTFPDAAVQRLDSELYVKGRRLVRDAADEVEDYAAAQLLLTNGCLVRLACSWRLSAGADALIEASFYGTEGGAAVHNVNGSFYDFVAERFRGTARETLASPPDAWGGRAAVTWAAQLAESSSYDPSIEAVIDVASMIDAIYRRA